MEFNSKTRKKSIKVWVSDEERALLEAKVNYYGYKRLARYVRDAVIYEKVTYLDIKNKNDIYNAYSENTKEIKKIAKEFKNFSKYVTQLDKNDIKAISIKLNTILKKQKDMLKLIDKKLNLDIRQTINCSNKKKSEYKCL